MARFELITTSTEEDPNEMGGAIRLSASGFNALAIQINKKPIVGNQQGKVEAMVKSGDIVSFLLNPRGIRDEKDCAAAAGSTCNANAADSDGKKSKEDEFWSMRFSVVQSQCNSNGRLENNLSVGQRQRDFKEPTCTYYASAQSDCASENNEKKTPTKANGGVDESVNSDHNNKDDSEEEDGTPVLSMHHFSATQWQNQSAIEITSMIADTPFEEDDDSDDNSEDNSSPALEGNVNNSSRDMSSFSLEELKKFQDCFSTSARHRNETTCTGTDPDPNTTNVGSLFHRALFSMVIRHQEKSNTHDLDEDDDEDDETTAAQAKRESEEGGDDHHHPCTSTCDQEISLPRMLEYTVIEE